MKIHISAFWIFFSVATGIIGKTIHGSTGWAIFDAIFSGWVWCKWLICHEVNLSIIKESFNFLSK